MPRLVLPDGEIGYEVTGDGPPLLFASGLGGLGRYWRSQIQAFAPRYRVVTYDHRGTGRSDREQRRYSIEGMAADVVALLDGLGIERTHFVGHSTGGAIGQVLGIEHPRRVRTLALSATWTHCDPFFRRLFQGRQAMLRAGGQELHSMFHPLWLYPQWWINEHDAEIEAEREQALADPAPVEVSIARIDALLAFDRRADLGRITTPTLVMGAVDDYICPQYFSEALARAIPDAKLYLASGSGHAASKTRPDEFNQVLGDFLAAHH